MSWDDGDFCGVGSRSIGRVLTRYLGRLARACKPHDWRDAEIINQTVFEGGADTHRENDQIFADTTDKLASRPYYDEANPGWRLRMRMDRLKRGSALVAIKLWRVFGATFLRRGP